ncbi:MAG: NAD+ synthase [Thermoflexales bacterium]|nr:NAD+ synthase [Thermoflexales bacterium]
MNDIASKLCINTDLARRLLVDFTRDEITRAGFQRAVLGLSGGVDSALAATLAVEALGAENVLALYLPYRTSSQESLRHAQLMIDRLGVAHETIDITPMADSLIERSPDMNSTRKGNVMARARMIVIYDRSAAWRGLVVGTSNKTELLLGYGTLFGDLASAVNPLGDLLKTQVRQLARALGVPEEIVAKPPSADLTPGQTDEGELGLSYAEVDQLLYLLVDERYTPDEAVAAGFAPDYVRGVWGRVAANHFKRRPPIIAKISNRTIGVDFLYPRDWGQ